MGDDHPAAGDIGRDLRQALGDIFVGETVKSVTPDAFGMELMRNGVVVRHRFMVR